MTEATAEAPKTKAPAKPKPEVVKVQMNDGREVEFVGKRNMNKDYTVGEEEVSWTFDFRTGDSVAFALSKDDPIIFELAGHGGLQKCGDEAAGEKEVSAMYLAVESVANRLLGTGTIDERWYAERTAGDSFSGASVVIKAIMEASGKPIEFVKAYLEKKLADSKAAGETPPLSRQKLYQSYRKPGTKIAAIISRLEQEALAAQASAVDADADLEEMRSME